MMYVRCWPVLVIVFLPLVTVVALPQPALGTGGFLRGMAPPVAAGASGAPVRSRPSGRPCRPRSRPRRRVPRRLRCPPCPLIRRRPRPPPPRPHYPSRPPSLPCRPAGRPRPASRSGVTRRACVAGRAGCPSSRCACRAARARIAGRSHGPGATVPACRSSRLTGRAGGARGARPAGARRRPLVPTGASAAHDADGGDQPEQANASEHHRDLLVSPRRAPAREGRWMRQETARNCRIRSFIVTKTARGAPTGLLCGPDPLARGQRRPSVAERQRSVTTSNAPAVWRFIPQFEREAPRASLPPSRTAIPRPTVQY